MVNIRKEPKLKLGYRVSVAFAIGLHHNDLFLLHKIKDFFKTGEITKQNDGCYLYRVQSIEGVGNIIRHFDEYPLITQKLADYLLFKQVYIIILNKKHLTQEGLEKCVSIKASLNLGLSDQLKTVFCDSLPVLRPVITNKEIPDPNWVSGFVEGDGCFSILVIKKLTRKQILVEFQVTQHERDRELMNSLIKYLGCF